MRVLDGLDKSSCRIDQLELDAFACAKATVAETPGSVRRDASSVRGCQSHETGLTWIVPTFKAVVAIRGAAHIANETEIGLPPPCARRFCLAQRSARLRLGQ